MFDIIMFICLCLLYIFIPNIIIVGGMKCLKKEKVGIQREGLKKAML